jgi:putative tryptophan/tyrosine transport system substrate-binding protein
MPRQIGLLHNGSAANFVNQVEALQRALPADVQIVPKFAQDITQPIDKIADDLIRDATTPGPNYLLALVAAGGPETAVLLRKKTKNLPNPPSIVFTTVVTPDKLDLVKSLNTPTYNLTGMAGQTSENDPKRLEILFELGSLYSVRKIAPRDTIGVLLARDRPGKNDQFQKVKDKASALNLTLDPQEAKDAADIQTVFTYFTNLANQDVLKGVVVAADSLFNDLRGLVVQYANACGVPTIYQWKEFVVAGGLVSFGPDILEAYDMAGQYVTRILDQGELPATMKCSTPRTFYVYLNRSTAQQLHITIPPTLGGLPVQVI